MQMNQQTKSDYIYNVLKKRLIKGEYKDLERLVVADIAKELGVSPMPVREALIRLAQDSFVEIIPHVGARVISYNHERMAQIHQIRCELEATATRLLAPIITDEQIAMLESILKEGRAIVESRDTKGYFKWNKKFHLTIIEMNPNEVLTEYINNTWQNLELISSRYSSNTWRYDESIEEHFIWIEALRTHDPVLAEAACRHHDSAVRGINIANYMN